MINNKKTTKTIANQATANLISGIIRTESKFKIYKTNNPENSNIIITDGIIKFAIARKKCTTILRLLAVLINLIKIFPVIMLIIKQHKANNISISEINFKLDINICN